MARITVEDCLNQIPNRFKLTLAATYRARELVQGHAPRLDSKDKPTVTALRNRLVSLAWKCCAKSRPDTYPGRRWQWLFPG